MSKDEIGAVLIGEKRATVWWTYNKQPHHRARKLGFLWTPEEGNMAEAFTLVSPHDVLLHYAKSGKKPALVGASKVQNSRFQQALRDDVKHQHKKPGDPGWRLNIEYYDLAPPIFDEDIPLEPRLEELGRTGGRSPFEPDGTFREHGTMHPMSPAFVLTLLRKFPASFAEYGVSRAR